MYGKTATKRTMKTAVIKIPRQRGSNPRNPAGRGAPHVSQRSG